MATISRYLSTSRQRQTIVLRVRAHFADEFLGLGPCRPIGFVLTNYTNHIAGTDVDFPVVWTELAAAA